MISRVQIKAARAMLDWSQKSLAERCKEVSEPTIKLLESGKVHSTESTLAAIRKTLENAGIEFLGDNGVRFRDNLLTVIEKLDQNDNPYLRLMEDVYHTTLGKFGEVLFSYVDQSLSPPEVVQEQLMIRQSGVSMRFLVRHGDTYLRYPLDEYRWLPKGHFLNSSTVIYGNKIAFYTTTTNKVIIINDENVSEVQRMQFNMIWNSGEKPTQTTAAQAHG